MSSVSITALANPSREKGLIQLTLHQEECAAAAATADTADGIRSSSKPAVVFVIIVFVLCDALKRVRGESEKSNQNKE